MSSKIKKKISPINTKSSKQAPSDLTNKFEFYARIVKLIVLREDNVDGKYKSRV